MMIQAYFKFCSFIFQFVAESYFVASNVANICENIFAFKQLKTTKFGSFADMFNTVVATVNLGRMHKYLYC